MSPVESLKALERAYDVVTKEPGAAAKVIGNTTGLTEKLWKLARGIEKAVETQPTRVSVQPASPSAPTAGGPATTVTVAPAAAKAAALSDEQWCSLGRALGNPTKNPEAVKTMCVRNGLVVPGLDHKPKEVRGNARVERGFQQIAVNKFLHEAGFATK